MGRSNPTTVVIDYSTWGEVLNAAGSTGAYLEQMSTTYSTVIGTIITRVSRAIDDFTLRRFYTSTGDETRYFDGPPWRPDFSGSWGPYAYATWGWAGKRNSGDLGFDVVSISSLSLANGTYDAQSTTYSAIDSRDYFLRPISRDGQPAQWIELSDAPIGTYSTAPFMWFSPGYETIRIVGKFGWGATGTSSIPDTIRQVCVEETVRWFKSRDASFSDMTGIADLTGAVPYSKFLSARSRFILEAYRRIPVSGL